MNINWDYYRIFLCVVKHLNITHASQELNVTQPAVSMSIKNLEQQIGTKLFIRSQKGLKLTKEGELFAQYLKEINPIIYEAHTHLNDLLKLEEGEIRIGASDMTLAFYLLPYLQKFHEKHPNVKIHVSNGPTPETLLTLKQKALDFAVVSSHFDLPESMQSMDVLEIADCFIVGKKYKELLNQDLSVESLHDYPLICLEKPSSTRRHLDEYFQEEGLSVIPEFELATSDMIVQFTKQNFGVGYVMKSFAREALDKKEVFEVKLQKPLHKRNFSIVRAQSSVFSSATKALLDLMLREEPLKQPLEDLDVFLGKD